MKTALTFSESKFHAGPALARAANWLIPGAAFVGILLTRLSSYLLFHSIAELFSVAVGFGVFIVAWNSSAFVKNSYLLILGLGCAAVAVIDSIHTLAFKGMGVFAVSGANLPTQLWLAGRYLQAFTWLIAPFFIRGNVRRYPIMAVYALATTVLLLSIFAWNIFPAAYIDGVGLTPFKVYSEYVIIAALLSGMGLLWYRRSAFDKVVLSWLLGSLLAAIASEFAFTLYFSVSDTANLVGHLFKIAEYFLLYRALVETGFTRPYSLLLRDLKKEEESVVAQEHGLAESRAAQIDAIFSSMADGAILYAADGSILRKNDAADQLFGYTRVPPDLPIEHRATMHSFIDEAGNPVVQIHDLPAFRAFRGETVHDCVLGVPSPVTGEIRWLAFSAVPVLDASGHPNGCVVTFRDITGRKEAEQEIRRLNDELERRIKARTSELEAANKELEAFVYSVSHDLRAPLRHIDGFVELLQRHAGDILDQKARHYLNQIAESARQMGTLIDDLLQFSRMGRSDMYETDVDLRKLVDEVIRSFRPEAHGRQVHWQIADLPCVTGDRAMLRIALANLVSNALKFTRPRTEARIEIGYSEENPEEYVVFIRDNGVGFDMNYSDKLFGVFQRLHRADEFEGTGIGLANVQRIVFRHGGRTWADGKPDGGATFYFSLPRSA